jgi:hypothetical protein
MRTLIRAALALALVAGLGLAAWAQDKKDKDAKPADKEVTLKGLIVCTKCELKETSECSNAIKVKEDGKDVIYYLKDKADGEKYHDDICTGPKKGSVTGVVSEKDKKKYITPKKDGVKFD